MKLGIIGAGTVGTANKLGFEHIGHKVVSHDIKLDTKITDIMDTDICFLCVPTPSTDDGDCNTSIIESVIDELASIEYKGIIAIRSTAVPGFTQSMIEKHKNLTIAFVPEFLRERCALDDFLNNHKLLAVGTHDIWVHRKMVECHGDLPQNIVHLTPNEAEVLKYYNNVYAAVRVTFANVMYEICEKLNCDYNTIKNAYIKTGKAIDMYLDVYPDLRGYGGACLPKDTKALAGLIKKLDLPFDLLDVVTEDNSKVKKTVFNGMRED
jgi:UDPglucose 6-dehydrogenase|tara:strand:+ start:6064 stop:6861 length:798 start_codon:yes stop_codon:yes gene_type:complete